MLPVDPSLHNEGARAPTRAEYLLSMRAVPGAIAIIATSYDGERRGLAATAWTSLTADPPTLLACVNRSASAHGPILAAGAFSISLLPTAHSETVAIFSAQRGLDGDARFLAGAWTTGPGGQPLLNEAIASFECALDNRHDYGSHTILIGRVTYLVAQSAPGEALLYVGGGYARAAALSQAAASEEG